MIVPFQCVMRTSSPSSSPYEHEPSPIPFSPFSSSSSRRKLRGTAQNHARHEKSCERARSVMTYSWPSRGRRRDTQGVWRGNTADGAQHNCRHPFLVFARYPHPEADAPVALAIYCFLPADAMFRAAQANPYDDIVGVSSHPSPIYCTQLLTARGYSQDHGREPYQRKLGAYSEPMRQGER
jgi:hypothetical protein